MSKIDSIAPGNPTKGSFKSSLDRLQAVESVARLVSNMVESEKAASFGLTDLAHLGEAYKNSPVMVQRRFDDICGELAIVARTGAQALLTLKSQGRTNLDAAANSLLREIDRTSAKLIALLRN
ncbi:hypothetical protein MNBD_ALPHA04-433 [hydrothermal vent metagenome]|uniref:Methyl-accepting chemotaxis protein n=1 Tax=hydrothermal vent metagenome TaxID=652676 RepID=A0A3B0RGW9_9ZZZZ